MNRFAFEIGRHIDGVRAVFLADSDNLHHLCELTFSPASTLSHYTSNEEDQLDAALHPSPAS